VVAELGADDDILDVDVVAIASGTSAGDDAVGVELVDHTLGAECGIDLADATLLDEDFRGWEKLLKLA
jgi:hypothetical protein